jgi:antitoxin MazE
MHAKIIRIGNSRGIRLPKALLDESQLGDTVDLSVEDGALIVRPVRQPRAGWEQDARRMHERGDDEVLDADSAWGTSFDAEEWDWPEA